MTRIALSAGHHNATGGNAQEIALVGPWTHALADALRARGFDVRVITPQDGLGTFPGDLAQAAATVVTWASAGWVADLFLELHGEANGQGNAGRGCFAIYPNAPGDLDVTVRDRLGPALTRAISRQLGIPLRGNGVMSERQTSVGLGGNRLGIFRVTASLRAATTRMILEVGAYSSSADLALLTAPSFPAQLAVTLTDALAAFYGLPVLAQPADLPVIGVAQQLITEEQWLRFCERNFAPLSERDARYVYAHGERRQVDMSFFGAVWAREGRVDGRLGASPLQQLTHCPLNIKAAEGEWRPTVVHNGARWLAYEDFFSGALASLEHLKTVYGWQLKRHTVRAIADVLMREAETTQAEVERYIKGVLEDMAYMRTH